MKMEDIEKCPKIEMRLKTAKDKNGGELLIPELVISGFFNEKYLEAVRKAQKEREELKNSESS